MGTIWRGARGLKEAPSSPSLDFTPEKILCTNVYAGPYETCLAKRPKQGTVCSTPLGSFKLASLKIVRAPGGRGIMTITSEHANDDCLAIDGLIRDYEEEIDWAVVEKAIEEHPRYALVEDETSEQAVLTADDLELVRQYFDTTSSAERKKQRKVLKDGTTASKKRAYELLLKKLRVESYNVYVPVVRRTSESLQPPVTRACGKRETPPTKKYPQGYEYLKTADRGSRSGPKGRWRRSEEWTGCYLVDRDLYEVAEEAEE